MNIENQDVLYCPEDDENGNYCDKYHSLCIEGFYKKHIKSQLILIISVNDFP